VAGNDVSENVLGQVTEDDQTANATEAVDATNPAELVGSMSVPVSRKAGVRWRTKIHDALEAYGPERKLWDKAFEQYRAVIASELLDPTDSTRQNRYKFQSTNLTDENIVRDTVKLQLRSVYTDNPTVTISTLDETEKDFAKCIERAVQALFDRRNAPGVNAKTHFRRLIVHAQLTNFGVVKLNFQSTVGSRQEALQRLNDIRTEMADSKRVTDLDELYAQLEEVEEELPLCQDKGMTLSNPLSHKLIVAPSCTYTDLTDADWCAEEVEISTDYIRQRYMKKNENDQWVRKSDGKGAISDARTDSDQQLKDDIAETVLGTTTDERARVLSQGMTRCYIIYDRLSQLISLYSDDDWKYPLWVWEDDLHLSHFYPFFILGFTEPVDGIVQPGETAYYSGLGVEINLINRKTHQIRSSTFGALIYNAKGTQKTEVERLIQHLDNPTQVKAFGIEFEDGKKLEDIVTVFVPPAYNYKDLFDKTNTYNTINRIANTSDAQRGGEFKTNTNTTAVNAYNEASNQSTSALTDQVEDVVGSVAWAMAEILVSKYTKQEIVNLIGEKNAEPFRPLTVDEFNTLFSMEIVAGTTEKPTSDAKKKEALAVAQAIGQVGMGAPTATLKVILKMFRDAFSSLVVTDDDLAAIDTEAAQNASKGVSIPQGAPQPGQPKPMTPVAGA
jgi:hypothetical protein